MSDEQAARVELLETERVRNVPERNRDAVPMKPITPAGARRNREVLAAALGHEDDYVPRGALWMSCDHSLPAGGA